MGVLFQLSGESGQGHCIRWVASCVIGRSLFFLDLKFWLAPGESGVLNGCVFIREYA